MCEVERAVETAIETEFSIEIINKLEWNILSRNFNAIFILEKYPHKINWVELASNENPKAIHLLEKYISENPNILKNNENNSIFWSNLSYNCNAIPILKQHLDKINWNEFSSNLSINKFFE